MAHFLMFTKIGYLVLRYMLNMIFYLLKLSLQAVILSTFELFKSRL